jgi:DNA-binding NtrC family response regulator
MQLLVNAYWPGNVRQLRNLIESMVVLAPGREIRSTDIPADVRDGGARLLPMRIPEQLRQLGGQEVEFILHSLVDLKVQVEELRRRLDETPGRVEVVRAWASPEAPSIPEGEAWEVDTGVSDADRLEPVGGATATKVVYRPGMTMADVERAAIEAALLETNGNRRRAAERLGIGERTLYRKIKEYGLS